MYVITFCIQFASSPLKDKVWMHSHSSHDEQVSNLRVDRVTKYTVSNIKRELGPKTTWCKNKLGNVGPKYFTK